MATQSSRLLSLPKEIRNAIYPYILPIDATLDVSRTPTVHVSTDLDTDALALFMTCEQVKDESTEHLFRHNEISIVGNLHEINECLRSLIDNDCQPVRRVKLCILCYQTTGTLNQDYQNNTRNDITATHKILTTAPMALTVQSIKLRILGGAWDFRNFQELFRLFQVLTRAPRLRVYFRFTFADFWPYDTDRDTQVVVLRGLLRRQPLLDELADSNGQVTINNWHTRLGRKVACRARLRIAVEVDS